MSYIKMWVHIVWSTKHRIPFLKTKKIRESVWMHIHENARKKCIHIDFVNGFEDHCHVLLSLTAEQKISEVVRLMKGESSAWINRSGILNENDTEVGKVKFGWQKQYFAMSISQSGVAAVRNYIKRQEEHHRKKTYAEEYNEIMERYGFESMKFNEE